MSEPPVPVEVSREDLRSGKFQLNPAAQVQRRAQRLDWKDLLAWFGFYIPGLIAGNLIKHAVHINQRMPWSWFWFGALMVLLVYVLVRFAYGRLSGGRVLPSRAEIGVGGVLVGIWSGLS